MHTRLIRYCTIWNINWEKKRPWVVGKWSPKAPFFFFWILLLHLKIHEEEKKKGERGWWCFACCRAFFDDDGDDGDDGSALERETRGWDRSARGRFVRCSFFLSARFVLPTMIMRKISFGYCLNETWRYNKIWVGFLFFQLFLSLSLSLSLSFGGTERRWRWLQKNVRVNEQLIDVMKRVFEWVSLKSLGESTFFSPTGERERREIQKLLLLSDSTMIYKKTWLPRMRYSMTINLKHESNAFISFQRDDGKKEKVFLSRIARVFFAFLESRSRFRRAREGIFRFLLCFRGLPLLWLRKGDDDKTMIVVWIPSFFLFVCFGGMRWWRTKVWAYLPKTKNRSGSEERRIERCSFFFQVCCLVVDVCKFEGDDDKEILGIELYEARRRNWYQKYSEPAKKMHILPFFRKRLADAMVFFNTHAEKILETCGWHLQTNSHFMARTPTRCDKETIAGIFNDDNKIALRKRTSTGRSASRRGWCNRRARLPPSSTNQKIR